MTHLHLQLVLVLPRLLMRHHLCKPLSLTHRMTHSNPRPYSLSAMADIPRTLVTLDPRSTLSSIVTPTLKYVPL